MQVMNRDQFDSWFEENIKHWIDKQVAETHAPLNSAADDWPDDAGLLDASDIFNSLSAFLADMNNVLYADGYKISLSRAYGLLATAIEWGMSNDFLGDDWTTVHDLFVQRENEFVGSPDEDIGLLSDSAYGWVRIMERLFYKWTSIETEDGKFSDADKLLLIRSTLIMFRNSRYLEYKGWVKELIGSLEVDWHLLGGGFPGGPVDPGYVPPWSGG